MIVIDLPPRVVPPSKLDSGPFEVQTTERYAYLAADWVRESSVRKSENIATEILPG